MQRREFLRTLGCGAVSLVLPGCYRAQAQTQAQPNFVFIFADDQCYEALHAFGCDEIHTPHLDRLVQSGTTFTHAYNQGAWHGAVCVASRTMLNTGRFLWHARALEPNLKQETKAGRFWSQQLKQAGYDTYMSGKWHVKGIKPEDIFDYVRDVRPGMPPPSQNALLYNRPHEGKPDPWTPWDKQFGGHWKGGKHWSEVLGDHAVSFLSQAGERDNPFFMYLAFNAPHDPRQSPKEYVERYPLDEVKVPVNYLDEYPYKDTMGCGKTLRDEKLAPFPRTKYAVKVHRQEYYAIITHMDAQVGRILEALEKSGKAKDTYIFFTADHGLAVGHHGLMGKQNMFDHSVRVPLMVVGPGVPKNRKLASPVYLQDIMPTTLGLAGRVSPSHIEFKSLQPLWEGKRKQNYEAIYGGYMNLQRMVTDDNYKLIYYPKLGKFLLFDLQKDPQEMHNLAEEARYAGRIEALKKTLRQLQKACGDTLVIP